MQRSRCWNGADEEFAMSKYEHRLRQGMSVWAHAVELFYEFLRHLRRLTQRPAAIPAICRFLQGNPYELQNELVIQQLFDCIGQGKRGREFDVFK